MFTSLTKIGAAAAVALWVCGTLSSKPVTAQPSASAPEKTGVAECDKLVDLGIRCIAPLAPAGSDRQAIEKFYRDLAQSYKLLADNPETRSTAVIVCTNLVAAQRSQLAGTACKLD